MSFTKQFVRSFGTTLRAANKSTVAKAADSGSFKTFAEYREFIVKKDPEALKARFNIMISKGKAEACPESEAENQDFGSVVKKVAYNIA